ncbi:MAG TPA: hypothetical protein VFW23_13900 [Tepidisphaeraceae bacterium]|nr:hypothetical protein [Tepidisphaeraceae bacterium]
MQRLYVDAIRGNDTESGLAASRPLATIGRALAIATTARMVLVIIEALGTFDLGEGRLHLPPGPRVVISGDGPDRTTVKSRLQNGPILWLNHNATVESLSVVGTAEKKFQFPIGDGGVSARNVTIRKVRTVGPTDGLYFTGKESTAICEDSILDSRWDTVFLRDGSKALLRRCELLSIGPNAINPHQHGLAQCVAGSILRLEDCVAAMRARDHDPQRKLVGIRAAGGGKVELAGFSLAVDVPDWQSRSDLLADDGEIAVSGGNIDPGRCRGNLAWG